MKRSEYENFKLTKLKIDYIHIRLVLFIIICILGIIFFNKSANASKIPEGTNVGNQDYETWSSAIESYLEPLNDGSFMRVQALNSRKYLLAEYYTPDFILLRTVKVKLQRPIFGAFYSYGGFYYVLTGQNNLKESNVRETYRVTKYDTSWNAIASCGLNGANTFQPFDFACARMSGTGKYVVVHTGRTMYETPDGKHHQANISFEFDTECMKITDFYYKISCESYGYVSHSFNQFVGIDDGKIITVDHGDAYPRSIVLMKYNTDANTGLFMPNNYLKEVIGKDKTVSGSALKVDDLLESTNLFKFNGKVGDNYTGASIGGFAITDSSYVVAGNYKIKMNKSKNIIILSQDKTTGAVSTNYLTNYSKKLTASTPHLVALEKNKLFLIWSVNKKLYYTLLDGAGNQIDVIHSAKGELSDCVPVIQDNNLVWYTWQNEVVKFYKLDISKMSKPQIITYDYLDYCKLLKPDLYYAHQYYPFKKRLFEIEWCRNLKATGYQIQYSGKKKFFNNKNIVTVKKKTSKKVKIKKISKYYYFRIRSYRDRNGVKDYSDWTKAKKVKDYKKSFSR